MAAKYDFFPTPLRKDDKEVKYHARLVTDGKLTTKDIARKIAGRCTIKESDVMGVFIALEDILCHSLGEGKIVHLDGVGSFRISAKSPTVKDKHEVRAESIEFKNIVYTPEKQLLRKLSATRFERVKYTHCSAELSGIEIDGLLMEYFKDHAYITTKAMRTLCGLSYATALRRLQERVKEGRLEHPGYLRSPFYFPVPGHFGVSREKSGSGTASD